MMSVIKLLLSICVFVCDHILYQANVLTADCSRLAVSLLFLQNIVRPFLPNNKRYENEGS